MNTPIAALLAVFLLPNLRADWQPVAGTMLTEWGKALEVSSVWSGYPRPQLEREDWTNLNGLWDFVVTEKDAAEDAAEDAAWWGEDEAGEEAKDPAAGVRPLHKGRILVPFCPESALSGVGRLIEPSEAMWYRRELPVRPTGGKRSLLHFGAVDYETRAWVNGREVGRHTGGHTPFSFDITDALKDGKNMLVLRVYDATEGFQARGKQALKPHGILASRVSGIWQTVWLEQVPESHIGDLDFATEIRTEKADGGAELSTTLLKVAARTDGKEADGATMRFTISLDGAVVAAATGGREMAIPIPEPRMWSPDSPTLYDVKAELLDGKGAVTDEVASYAALRTVGRITDARGRQRISLNGREIFLLGPLDQGWWPDGLLTPPSDEAMLADLRFIKAAGYNMLRKHVKVEPARFYYHCDRLGIAVWQDQVNAGMWKKDSPKGCSPEWIGTRADPEDGEWPEDAHQQWVAEYKAMVDHLRDHPSILVWCPFNEAWGQHRSMEIGKMAKEYDPTRLVCIASGGNFWPVGDITSQHNYPEPRFPAGDPRFRDMIHVVGEMGGYGLRPEGHEFDHTRSWGYRMVKTVDEWKSRYRRTMSQLLPMRGMSVSAAVYTQTSDFETEVNGLMSYDRIPKVDPAWLKQQNERVIEGRGFHGAAGR